MTHTPSPAAPATPMNAAARPAPSLHDCRRLFLRNYSVLSQIGVHAHEKLGPQRLLLNVELYVPLALSTPQQDELDEVVDYDFIRSSILARINQGAIGLQETLVDDVLRQMLAHPKVRAARVSSEKPDVYPDCEAVGVEVFGFKDIAV